MLEVGQIILQKPYRQLTATSPSEYSASPKLRSIKHYLSLLGMPFTFLFLIMITLFRQRIRLGNINRVLENIGRLAQKWYLIDLLRAKELVTNG
jgi:uncharacterized membrane protein YeiB